MVRCLKLFAKKKKEKKKKKKDELLRAPRVGRHSWTRVDEARKSWGLLAVKMPGTSLSGEGGEDPAM